METKEKTLHSGPGDRSLVGLWGLSRAQASALMPQCRQLELRRGASLVQRGARLPGVFVVVAGSVKLALRTAEGEERVLHIAAPGESFGEAPALLDSACLYDAVALGDTRVLVVPAAAIFRLLANEPSFARRLVLALADRSYTALAEFEAAITQRGAQRLAGYLDSLPKRNGASGATTVELPVSKTVVAALLGMKKETLSRLLHQLAAQGIIGVARREIAILDHARLAEVAGQS